MQSRMGCLLFVGAMVWLFTGCFEPPSVLENVDTVKDAQTTLSSEVDQVLASANLSSEEKSEKIADIGKDALESPKGFTMAKAVFDEALRANPSNERAEFYSTVLDVPMALEGVLGDAKEALTDDVKKEIDDTLLQSDQKEVSDFLMKEDAPKSLNLKFKSDELRALMSVADDHPEQSFGMAKPSKIQSILETKILPVLTRVGDHLDVFFLTHADFKEKIDLSVFVKKEERPFIVVIDKATYLALRAAIQAAIAAIKIAVSYDLDDIKLLEAHIKSLREDPGPLAIVNAINDHPSFLKLKSEYLSSDNPKRVHLDLMEVFKTAHELFDLLTALDSNGDHVRKMECAQTEKCIPNLDPNDAKVIKAHEYLDLFHDLIDDSMNADGTMVTQPVQINNIGKDEDQSIRVDLTSFLSNREERFNDLKLFLPTFETEMPMFPDLSFGGLFPDHDLFCFLKSQSDPNEEHPIPDILCPRPPEGGDSWEWLPEYQPGESVYQPTIE